MTWHRRKHITSCGQGWGGGAGIQRRLDIGNSEVFSAQFEVSSVFFAVRLLSILHKLLTKFVYQFVI